MAALSTNAGLGVVRLDRGSRLKVVKRREEEIATTKAAGSCLPKGATRDVTRIADYRHPTKREAEMMVKQLVTKPMPRIRAWPVPPHWSRSDWYAEMTAQEEAATWQALRDYDPERGVPLSAFVHQRVLTSALTRYRQEWSYAAHCLGAAPADNQDKSTAESLSFSAIDLSLRCALARLSALDRWLIEQLFWEERTEAEIARSLGISQPAVSKRKRAILAGLRGWLCKQQGGVRLDIMDICAIAG